MSKELKKPTVSYTLYDFRDCMNYVQKKYEIKQKVMDSYKEVMVDGENNGSILSNYRAEESEDENIIFVAEKMREEFNPHNNRDVAYYWWW